jgi:hypothetical protein
MQNLRQVEGLQEQDNSTADAVVQIGAAQRNDYR